MVHWPISRCLVLVLHSTRAALLVFRAPEISLLFDVILWILSYIVEICWNYFLLSFFLVKLTLSNTWKEARAAPIRCLAGGVVTGWGETSESCSAFVTSQRTGFRKSALKHQWVEHAKLASGGLFCAFTGFVIFLVIILILRKHDLQNVTWLSAVLFSISVFRIHQSSSGWTIFNIDCNSSLSSMRFQSVLAGVLHLARNADHLVLLLEMNCF